MANRIYIIPRRTDLDGANLQLLDLWPNSSQRNGVLDPAGQSCYVGSCVDLAGTTKRSGDSWAGGSRNTLLAAADDTAAVDVDGDAQNDALATQTACFGLAAYLRERVHPGGIGNANAGRMTWGHANTLSTVLATKVSTGSALTLVDVNAALSDANNGGVAQSDLDGSGGMNSKSFGSVADILRILSGEVYVSPRYVVICNANNQFRSLAQRNTQIANQTRYLAQGHFLAVTESGYRGRPVLVQTGAFNVSNGGGLVKAFKSAVTFLNPAFAYTAGEVLPDRPRASTIAGAAVPTSGSAVVLAVYDANGNVV